MKGGGALKGSRKNITTRKTHKKNPWVSHCPFIERGVGDPFSLSNGCPLLPFNYSYIILIISIPSLTLILILILTVYPYRSLSLILTLTPILIKY
jgi:hypothetical protein